MRLANEHSFSAWDDAKRTALDAVWAFTFGMDNIIGGSKANLDLLTAVDTIEVPSGNDEPVVFPDAKINDSHEALRTIIEKSNGSVQSLIPQLIHWLQSWQPAYRKAMEKKESMISFELANAKNRFSSTAGSQIRCALDHILNREMQAAEKEDRAPNYHVRTIYDEVCDLLI
jgi:hypothetical protein